MKPDSRRKGQAKSDRKGITLQSFLKKHGQWDDDLVFESLKGLRPLKLRALLTLALHADEKLTDKLLEVAGIRTDVSQRILVKLYNSQEGDE
jgi:hypothetical protein